VSHIHPKAVEVEKVVVVSGLLVAHPLKLYLPSQGRDSQFAEPD
jgi:hypothetical protein